MSSSSYKPNNNRVVILQSGAAGPSRSSSLYSTGSSAASRSSQYTTYSSQSTMDTSSRSSSSSSRGSGTSDRIYRNGRADPNAGYATRVQEIPQRNGPGIVLIQHNHNGGSSARREEKYSHQSTHGSSGSRGHIYYK